MITVSGRKKDFRSSSASADQQTRYRCESLAVSISYGELLSPAHGCGAMKSGRAGGYSLFAFLHYKTMEYPPMTANTPFVVSEFLKSAVCTLYLAGAQASGANIDVAGRTLHDRFDALDIGLPCTVGTTVRVRDLDTKCDALAADFAFCHSWHLLYRLVNKIHFTRKRKKNQVFFSDFRIFIKFHKNRGSKGRFLRILISCRQCRRVEPAANS